MIATPELMKPDLALCESIRRFIPVCLYTRIYNRRDCVRDILERFVASSDATLIVVADDLQAYNQINRGYPEELAFRNARIQGDNLSKMFQKESEKLNLSGKINITTWREITARPDYKLLFEGLSQAFSQRDDLLELRDAFVKYHLRRLRSQRNKVNSLWETRYLLEEVTMSVFVPECLGYTKELWELAPKQSEPDPISYLYNTCNDLLLNLTNKTHLDRQIEFLK